MVSEDQVALVTGGASGLGLGVTEQLLNRGWNVAIVDISQERGDDVVKRLGSKVLFIRANVAVWEELSKTFVQTWAKWGRLDFVYANAGIGDRTPLFQPAKELPDGSPPQPDTLVIDICLKAVAWTAYLAVHYFRKNAKKGGKIVCTASQAGLYSSSTIPLYSAAKRGVVGLTYAMGSAFAKTGEPITVNCVCPGVVRTNIMPGALLDATPEEHVTTIAQVVKAVLGFVDDSSLQGQVAEVSAQNVYFVPQKEYSDDATRWVYSNGSVSRVDSAKLMKQMLEIRATLSKNLGETK